MIEVEEERIPKGAIHAHRFVNIDRVLNNVAINTTDAMEKQGASDGGVELGKVFVSSHYPVDGNRIGWASAKISEGT